jgi:hypothetical protein
VTTDTPGHVHFDLATSVGPWIIYIFILNIILIPPTPQYSTPLPHPGTWGWGGWGIGGSGGIRIILHIYYIYAHIFANGSSQIQFSCLNSTSVEKRILPPSNQESQNGRGHLECLIVELINGLPFPSMKQSARSHWYPWELDDWCELCLQGHCDFGLGVESSQILVRTL